MDIALSAGSISAWTGEGIAIATYAFEGKPTGALAAACDRWGDLLRDAIADEEFTGESGTSVAVRLSGDVRKVLVVGLGEPSKVTLDSWRVAAAKVVRWAKQVKCQTLAFEAPAFNQDRPTTAAAIAEGLLLAHHHDKRFKSGQDEKKPDIAIERVELLGHEAPDEAEATQAAIAMARYGCEGAILARELVSAPANLVTPLALAETAKAIAAQHGDCMTVKILERDDCQALHMGAFLAVAQASELPPKFIHLTYRDPAAATPHRKLAIVGKGLTFDSGGLNIKAGAGSGIEMMKTDMGGAAATLGAAKAIAQIRPRGLEIHFLIAACENMISGKAIHPGDVVTASNGRTIEVNNTDAEGRLTLADALVYGDRLGVDAIVDLATLTGACVVALGDAIAGLWTNDEDLGTRLETAARHAGESIWRMPLEASYFEQMKSVVADFKNTGGRAGGAITAALFLQKFVERTPAWAHLDIAGPVWAEKESGYTNAGGTGYAVRTLVRWAMGYEVWENSED